MGILQARILEWVALPPRHAHGDLTSLAPHERLPEILVVRREKIPTGAAGPSPRGLTNGPRLSSLPCKTIQQVSNHLRRVSLPIPLEMLVEATKCISPGRMALEPGLMHPFPASYGLLLLLLLSHFSRVRLCATP